MEKQNKNKAPSPWNQKFYDEQCALLKQLMLGEKRGFYMIAEHVNDNDSVSDIKSSFSLINSSRLSVLETVMNGLEMDNGRLLKYAGRRILGDLSNLDDSNCACGNHCNDKKDHRETGIKSPFLGI